MFLERGNLLERERERQSELFGGLWGIHPTSSIAVKFAASGW